MPRRPHQAKRVSGRPYCNAHNPKTLRRSATAPAADRPGANTYIITPISVKKKCRLVLPRPGRAAAKCGARPSDTAGAAQGAKSCWPPCGLTIQYKAGRAGKRTMTTATRFLGGVAIAAALAGVLGGRVRHCRGDAGRSTETARTGSSERTNPQENKKPNPLVPFTRRGKWGYVDATGRVVIRPRFESAEPFQDGVGVVQYLVAGQRIGHTDKGTRVPLLPSYGYIDEGGRPIISRLFHLAGPFSCGVAQVQIGTMPLPGKSQVAARVKDDGTVVVTTAGGGQPKALASPLKMKSLFINKSGKTVFRPPGKVHAFSEGLAAVEIRGRFGYLNTSGRIVIRPKFLKAGTFRRGLAPVQLHAPKGGSPLWGYIDRKGATAIALQFTGALAFSDGLAAVRVRPGNKWGYIDTKGKTVINPRFGRAMSFDHGLARVTVGGKWGLIDPSGRTVVEPRFDAVSARFSSGLMPVRQGGKWGYVGRDGKMVISPRFESASGFRLGLARVRIYGERAAIDRAGRYVSKSASFSLAQALATSPDKATEALVAALNGQDKVARAKALAAAAKSKDPALIAPLVALVKDEWAGKDRPKAVAVLGAMKDPRAVGQLAAVLKDADSSSVAFRRLIVTALRRIGGKEAVAAIVAALMDESQGLERHAARALVALGEPAVMPLAGAVKTRIQEILKSRKTRKRPRPSKAVRQARARRLRRILSAAAWAMGELGDKRAVPTLTQILENRGSVKEGALALVKLGSPPVSQLMAILRGARSGVTSRTEAAVALGEIKDVRGIPPLITTLADKDQNVRKAANKALESITGQQFGDDQDKWRAWWAKNRQRLKDRK